MWQFANLCQWIYIFGRTAKIDDSIDIEELETECLKPQSGLLSDLALALLKLLSLHRGLTPDILDEQLRKQYLAKAPEQSPLGNEADPATFADLDVFTKIKILQTLTQWIMIYPERIREKMEEQKDIEQVNWRIEPYGWDSQDRVYFVLDDNRIYRLTEPTSDTLQPKPKSTKRRRGRRINQRRRVASSSEAAGDEITDEKLVPTSVANDGLGGGTWECVAVTLQETRAFLDTLARTRDENEKVLRKQLEKHLLPILEKQEETMKRKQAQRERELINLAKLANAKRSSRIADKIEKQKHDEEDREHRHQRLEAEQAELRENLARVKAEQERDFRTFARQRRMKEREARRIRHEEELVQLSGDSKNAPETARISERRLQAEIESKRQALRDIEQEEEDWIFDCVCGLYGQVDDGTHSVACERCYIWQHSKCVGICEDEAEEPEFHFICQSCSRRQDGQSGTPKTVIRLKVRPSNTPIGASQNKEPPMSLKEGTAEAGDMPKRNDTTATNNGLQHTVDDRNSANIALTAPFQPSTSHSSHPTELEIRSESVLADQDVATMSIINKPGFVASSGRRTLASGDQVSSQTKILDSADSEIVITPTDAAILPLSDRAQIPHPTQNFIPNNQSPRTVRSRQDVSSGSGNQFFSSTGDVAQSREVSDNFSKHSTYGELQAPD
ncbi:hypothetical protein QQS21_002412 [Conoideocrella luteorostrata]|uniref:Zinc finger PHD-type domain-containing protein n=1 Tax=Conoideocrella luteorostrata TaxID=1105319 RepID=A0AAJ0CZB5_9HYPO|nr:hypothetical protein QQS21_002412 [Conoideocrella luteorostrata]